MSIPAYLSKDAPHYVYSFWADDGACLYVGCTGRLGGRLRAHEAERAWWPDVAEIDVTVYPDCATAEAVERDLIERLQPTHNRVYTEHFPNAGGWETRRRNGSRGAARRALRDTA